MISKTILYSCFAAIVLTAKAKTQPASDIYEHVRDKDPAMLGQFFLKFLYNIRQELETEPNYFNLPPLESAENWSGAIDESKLSEEESRILALLKNEGIDKLASFNSANSKFGLFANSNHADGLRDISSYVNRTVKNVQKKLNAKGVPDILDITDSPATTLDQIPFVKLKFFPQTVSGFKSLQQCNSSRGFYSSRMYSLAKHKFDQIEFSYVLRVTYFGIYNVFKKIKITLYDAPGLLFNLVHKDKTMIVLNYEFQDPDMYVEAENGDFIWDYIINALIQSLHTVVKDKVVQVCSRDLKYLIIQHVNEIQ